MRTAIRTMSVGFLSLLLPFVAHAEPVPMCIDNGNNTQTCNLVETNSSGGDTERPAAVPLVFNRVSGYVVLLEPGTAAADEQNSANWSEVVFFKPGGFVGIAESLVLYSDSEGSGFFLRATGSR
jgi:hypothetical protein